ncbi:succinylglutamate desuccinylase [Natronospirillum operosum]|uniref:Succinylglutamate desuccinylase n=1 Tax=Natronospirillum operosum TaxID=2759953 RepID=A0A4Z0W626_9GAMM|nr:succinylglutamate desuccinylase [Natronospirillum operosum]TGG90199.1 succinylglutamate desuccinylase [Natronospirillum operosum]
MPSATIDFLHTSLTEDIPATAIETPGALLTWEAPGILSVEPHEPSHLPAAIISVGVHGDETVPVRLVDHWLRGLVEKELRVQRPLLVLLANPGAVQAGTRFVEHNMNRLFSSSAALGEDAESRRARVLMKAVQWFVERHPDGLHFDLHSTIKPSDRERFALVPPACAERPLTNLMKWFQRFAVDAWVQNRSAAATFANFSAGLGYLSATLELGQVSAIDEPLDRFMPIIPELEGLAQGPSTPSGHQTQGYQVLREIIRPEGEFEVCLQDFVNFRPLTAGTVIARGETEEWTIEQTGDALLFLNAQVPVGHRVALVIRPN